MAAYYITAATKEGTRSIKEVYAITVAKNKVYKCSKAEIIEKIEAEAGSVYTLSPSRDGNPHMAEVIVYSHTDALTEKTAKFLRTSRDSTPEDNLGNLPVF